MSSPPRRLGSPFSELMGFQLLEREDGLARLSMTVEERHTNTVGIAHGGVLTSIMDTASGAAVTRQPSVEGRPVTTISLNVTYLAPAFAGDTIIATARRRGRGRRVITCEVQAENQDGELLGIGTCVLRVRTGSERLVRGS